VCEQEARAVIVNEQAERAHCGAVRTAERLPYQLCLLCILSQAGHSHCGAVQSAERLPYHFGLSFIMPQAGHSYCAVQSAER